MKSTQTFKWLFAVLFVLGLIIAIIDGSPDKVSYSLMGVGFLGFLYVLNQRSRKKFEEQYFEDYEENN